MPSNQQRTVARGDPQGIPFIYSSEGNYPQNPVYRSQTSSGTKNMSQRFSGPWETLQLIQICADRPTVHLWNSLLGHGISQVHLWNYLLGHGISPNEQLKERKYPQTQKLSQRSSRPWETL